MLNRHNLFNQSQHIQNKNITKDNYIYELAALCQHVYKGNDCPPLGDGWELFSEYVPDPHEDNGYYGACYIKKQFDEPYAYYHVVFAHRGTIISFDDIGASVENLIGDINVALGHIPAQYYNANQFVLKTLGEIEGKKYQYHLIQTGHSLGAIIADLLSVLKRPTPFSCQSYTFDNPGSKPIIEEMIKRGEADPGAIDQAKRGNNAYQSNPNVINTCNEQATKVSLIEFRKWNYNVFDGPMIPIPSSYILNLYYIFGYTPERHAIKTICESLKENCNYNNVIEWPYGLKAGYKRYLSDSWLDGSSHYWSGYAEIIWQKRPDIQEEYHWYYRHFYLDFLDFLHQTRDNVMNLSSNKSMLFFQVKSPNDIDKIIDEFIMINKNDTQDENKKCVLL
jgi:hypothetical protein